MSRHVIILLLFLLLRRGDNVLSKSVGQNLSFISPDDENIQSGDSVRTLNMNSVKHKMAESIEGKPNSLQNTNIKNLMQNDSKTKLSDLAEKQNSTEVKIQEKIDSMENHWKKFTAALLQKNSNDMKNYYQVINPHSSSLADALIKQQEYANNKIAETEREIKNFNNGHKDDSKEDSQNFPKTVIKISPQLKTDEEKKNQFSAGDTSDKTDVNEGDLTAPAGSAHNSVSDYMKETKRRIHDISAKGILTSSHKEKPEVPENVGYDETKYWTHELNDNTFWNSLSNEKIPDFRSFDETPEILDFHGLEESEKYADLIHDIDFSKITVPEISVPKFRVPEFSIPTFKFRL